MAAPLKESREQTDSVPREARNLRACLICSLVKVNSVLRVRVLKVNVSCKLAKET